MIERGFGGGGGGGVEREGRENGDGGAVGINRRGEGIGRGLTVEGMTAVDPGGAEGVLGGRFGGEVG